ncbi:hypothetical protein IM40_09845 (plasmid) [Candidatus Paracaedimonas acanthamoebae]|nr:hypothetical protein IM40_09845 [Candidatus Paracaedimonas acanthamoebae]
MSKKLDSILNKVPHATVTVASTELEVNKIYNTLDEKMVRLTAEVPYRIKRQIKQYVADHPGETERTVILKGLKLLGLNIDDRFIHDMRSSK